MLSLHYRAPHGAYLPVREETWQQVNKVTHTLPDFPQLKKNLPKMMKEYSASVSHFDWNFGRLMKKVAALGLDKNTVVIFTSDHGYNVGHHGATHKGNGDWGSSLPRSYHHPNLDKLPGKKMPNMWDNPLIIQHDTHNKYVLRGLRTKKWKIYISFSHDFGFLYDLEKDPGETKNLYLSPEYSSARKKMTRALIEKMKAVGDPLFLPGAYPFSKSKITLPNL